MILWLVLIPIPFAALCLTLPSGALRRVAMVAGAAAHLGLVMRSWAEPMAPLGALAIDPLAHLFITLISVLFLATSIYFVGYHQKALVSQRVFLACMLALLTCLTLVCASRHLGLLWVALEASSLAATPLIYFRLGPRALEATWKFMLMNSVGIALALMGVFCVALATTATDSAIPLTITALVDSAAQGKLDVNWLRAGFLLAIVGFGTKMGLAPLHSWKPDAYGEAPPPAAALLAGGMTLGAFIGLLRIYQVVAAAGQGAFAGFWMTVFGLLSIAVAAVFIIGNNDYRRLLAYTSVEHMGVLVLGVGISSTGQAASMLHAMHNTLNKGILFFVAGILWRIYRTNHISDVRGAVHRYPLVGVLLLLGICATTGMPPFGMFFSEFGILLAAVQQSQWWVASLFALTLAVVFIGVMTALLPMAFGEAPAETQPVSEYIPGWWWRQPVMLLPAGALAVLALTISLYQPQGLRDALNEAAKSLDTAPKAPAIVMTLQQEGRP